MASSLERGRRRRSRGLAGVGGTLLLGLGAFPAGLPSDLVAGCRTASALLFVRPAPSYRPSVVSQRARAVAVHASASSHRSGFGADGVPVSNQPHAPSESDGASATASFGRAVVTRRASLASAAASAIAFLPQPAAANVASLPSNLAQQPTQATIPSLTIPLEYQPNLSAYTVSYTVGRTRFGAIIDTGSPFLLVPHPSDAACSPGYKWGCFKPNESRPAVGPDGRALDPTVERFDGNEGYVEWRQGAFAFDATMVDDVGAKNGDNAVSVALGSVPAANAASLLGGDAPWESFVEDAQSALFPRSLLTFGVISESLMDGPGGIFLGLVKQTNARIRPSFLGQSDVAAFAVDLRNRGGDKAQTLTLYGGADGALAMDERSNRPRARLPKSRDVGIRPSFDPSLDPSRAVPLVRDLNQRYGDPTVHYVGVADSITVNGSKLASSKRGSKIYCIFDTGCSGMSISPALFDERYAAARANREKSLWGKVDVELRTSDGRTVTLHADRPIATPLGSDRPWGRRLDGHLVVVGLAFLEGRRTTVDIDGERAWFEG